MKGKKHLLHYMLPLIVCLLIGGDVSAEDTALVYVIDIRTEIGSGVASYISKGIEKAEQAGADAIVFDVNTPGGRVDAAFKIMNAIRNTRLPTIAFVNRQALSAGAMISSTCSQIVMTSGAIIGASAPVDAQGQEAVEKYVSSIRGAIRAAAEQNRNADIAEAMVDKKYVLVRFESGDIIRLRPEEYIEEQTAGTKMEVLCAEGELLTLTTRQALAYKFVEAQAETLQQLLSRYYIVTIEGDDTGNVALPPPTENTADIEAQAEAGIATRALTENAILDKQEELGATRVKRLKSLANAQVRKIAATLADRVVFFITSPYISALLLSLGGLGLLIEIRTPGFGIPGFLGLLFIGLFFGGHMLNQIEVGYAFLAFVIGLALIVVEVFVIPGFGIAGILGIILMVGSAFFVFFDTTDNVSTALLWLSISIILTSVLGIIATIFLPKSAPFQRFALSTVMSTDEGYHAAGTQDFESFIGKTGVALTPLRPAGTAKIDNKRLDVVTVGNFIPENTPIKVLEVSGSKISVEALEE